MQFVQKILNALINTNATNTGGIWPAAATGASVTAGKSYAYGAYAVVVIPATQTTANWVTSILGQNLYISGGARWLVQLASGAAGSEVALTGSTAMVGSMQDTAVGHVMDMQFNYGPYPIYFGPSAGINAKAGSSNNAADVLLLTVPYRTGIGN